MHYHILDLQQTLDTFGSGKSNTILEPALPTNTIEMSRDEFDEYYSSTLLYLRRRFSHCFKKVDPTAWSIATWSNRTRRSSIEQRGSTSDKELLGTYASKDKYKETQKIRRSTPQT